MEYDFLVKLYLKAHIAIIPVFYQLPIKVEILTYYTINYFLLNCNIMLPIICITCILKNIKKENEKCKFS